MFSRIGLAAVMALVLYLFPDQAFAQKKAAADSSVVTITDTTDIDALFKRARTLAYNKEYDKSRIILNAILDSKPDYYDVRTFLGRTYSWDQQYSAARTEFSRVLIEKPDFADALDALIDVEIWTEQFTVANEYLRIALGYYPTSEIFLMKKVKISLRQQDKLTASLTLRKILELNPGNKDALKMLNDMVGVKLNNRFTLGYVVDFFDKQRTPQQLTSAEYGKSFSFGSLSARFSYADKFNTGGWQSELDAYLNFVKGTYAYLNAGYSDASVFPDFRLGGDLYQKLFSGFEASVGGRYLNFSGSDSLRLNLDIKSKVNPSSDSSINVMKSSGTIIYTGYIGNYFRNYWFAVKIYYTPESSLRNANGPTFTKKAGATFILNVRRYFGDADNYFGVRVGRGQSPDEKSAATIDPSTLKTYSGAAELQRGIFGRWLIKSEVGYSIEEISAGNFLQRITVNAALRNIF